MNYNEFLHTKVQVAPVSGFAVRPETAAAAYVYNPCVETADKMYEAFYGIKRNEKPRGMSLGDFLAGKD